MQVLEDSCEREVSRSERSAGFAIIRIIPIVRFMRVSMLTLTHHSLTSLLGSIVTSSAISYQQLELRQQASIFWERTRF